MAIEPGEKGRASDFIYAADISADQADDEGKVAKLGPNGRIEEQFIDHAFGDGSDGDIVLDGSTDFATFSSRSGSDYTLTRDVYFNNLTINGGVNLITAGWRIFVKFKIDGSGKVSWNGANGTNGGGGFTTNSGSGSANNQGSGGAQVNGYFSNQPGTNGGSGRRQDHGEAGISATAVKSSLGFNGGAGGAGVASTGDTGGVGTQNGGAGGTIATRTTPATKYGIIKAFTLMGLDIDFNSTETYTTSTEANTDSGTWGEQVFAPHAHTYTLPVSMRKVASGSGGTGGGAGGGSNSGSGDGWGGGGGGGGASGGIIFIVAREWAGTFEIEARGGNGGVGGAFASTVNGAGGGGGGGGGAGGVAVIIYQRKTWTGAFDFAGGTGGAGGAGGTDSNGDVYAAGTNGANGTDGDDYQFFIGDLM